MSPESTLDADLQGRCNAIAQELASTETHAGEHLYAIVDLAAVQDPAQWLSRIRKLPEARNLFAGQPEAQAETLACWLVPVRIESEDRPRLLHRTVKQALNSDSVSWLLSMLAADALAARLSHRLTAQLPEGEALFRYYDPRLFPVIREHANDLGSPGFFDVARAWGCLNEHGDLQWLELSREPLTAADRFVPPAHIGLTLQRALQIASEQHQLARLLTKRRFDALKDWTRSRKLTFVREHDARARSEGIDGFPERLNFCIAALDECAASQDAEGKTA
jgi:hypothetical protein